MPQSAAPSPMFTPSDAASGAGLARLALGFVVLMLVTTALIVLGALVRAHGAGLACPDWPLCFGRVIPEIDFEVAFEWSHRVLAGAVSLAFAALAFGVLRRPAARPAARQLLALAAGLLLVQVLLGALTVWLLLASWTVTAHLITGNLFSLTLLLIACSLRDTARPPTSRPPAAAAAHGLVVATAALLLLQMLLGGLVSSNYAGLACPEWPTCNGGQWFPTLAGSVGLHLAHRTNGYLLFAMLAAAAFASRRDVGLRRFTFPALALGLCEVAVGIANVTLGIPVEVTGLHSLLAAALVLTLTLAVRDTAVRRAPAA